MRVSHLSPFVETIQEENHGSCLITLYLISILVIDLE